MGPRLPGVEQKRSVSSVVGVVLLVAITVILATVVATFAASMGPSAAEPAKVDIAWTNESGVVTLRHVGGEAIDSSAYTVVVEEETGARTWKRPLEDWPSNDRMTAGKSIAIGFNTVGASWLIPIPVQDVKEIRLVWNSPKGDRSQVVARWTG